MDYRFYLIDDDLGVLHMLTHIILEERLGDVVGKSSTGEDAVQQIQSLRPDVVLVDLLLPKKDGIAIVREIKERLPHLPIVMISEVTAKDLVAKAYEEGVEYYIHKPINVREVVAVIRHIDEKLKLKAVVSQFQQAFQSIQTLDTGLKGTTGETLQDRALRILADLGISTESGGKDLLHLVMRLEANGQGRHWTHGEWTLSDLFMHISALGVEAGREAMPPRTIEQRVRRAIIAAMHHLAHFGLEDFEHELMHQYARTYFDFGELRKTMRAIEHQQREEGKVNVKKFIVAFLQEVFRT